MPKYKVMAPSFIGGRRVKPGEVIEFDGTPGSKLQLVEKSKSAAAAIDTGATHNPPPEPVEIPADWQNSLNALARIALARKLKPDAPKNMKAVDADKIIADEAARRATT